MSGRAHEEPRDFLLHCVPATTGNPILEEVRDRSANALLGVYRLVKTGIVHAADNQALHHTAEQTHAIIREFTAAVGSSLSITFAGDTAFANGQLVRASRKVYELVWDLQRLLQRCDVSELVFEPEVGPAELLRLAVTTALSLREASQREALLRANIPNVLVRRVDPVLGRRENEDEVEIRERILRFYASGLLVLRKFFDEVAQGVVPLPHRIKRIAQRLVTLAEAGDPTMLGLMTMLHAHRDDAGRALQSAILAVVVGRELTRERVPLSRLAMAAIMADAGRVRVAGSAGRDRLVPLGDEDEAAVPALTNAVNIATGGVNPPAALRTVLGHEVTWMEREELLGPLHRRELPPLVASRILRMGRAVLDRVAPRDTSLPMSPMDAIAATAALPDADPVLVRLLVRALGIIPVGTVVEFETGEWAVVTAASSNAEAFDRPQVKLLTDRQGRALEAPKLVDLGASSGARVHPRISHILPPAHTKFNVTWAFVT
jgi:hypothetical protein